MTAKKKDEAFKLEKAAVETMVGDIMDIAAQISSMPVGFQRSATLKNEVTRAVADAISFLASNGRERMEATIKKATISGELKFDVVASGSDAGAGYFLEALAEEDHINVILIEKESTRNYGADETEQRELPMDDKEDGDDE